MTVPDNYDNRFNSIVVAITYLQTSHNFLSFPHLAHFPLFPDSRFPIPDSRFPTPDSRFPIPDSLLPTPYSLLPLI
ncbi:MULTISPECIES: hypothetical protein [unclassified Moorena]|uniref:hypothetical protein n=1 Tax=unclassified Moorena TaxID=2683338 RepID=UPI0013C54B07|nr:MULTISPECIES: hypothetical protein [unclassified Moorena]NEO22603.1 hypothetical protein [Moorena sp. SIO4A5]NEQ61565.1 hypothetical protein [Moorena sp. SIO4A1]